MYATDTLAKRKCFAHRDDIFFRLIKKLLSKSFAKQIKKHYICTRKENFATMKRFYAYSFFYYFYFNRK